MVVDRVRRGGLRGRAHLSFLLIASLVVPLALFAAHAWQSHDRAFREAEDRLRRRVATLSEHVARIFDTQATVIDLIISKLEGRDPTAIATSAELADLLVQRGKQRMVGPITVLDLDGVPLLSNYQLRGNRYDDREYFRAAMATSDLVVSEQIRGRVSNLRFFTLSRRWYGGVVAIGLQSSYFEEIFAATVGRDLAGGVASLYRVDGKQLARAPLLGEPINLTPSTPGLMQQIPEADQGTYRIMPLAGPGERLYAFHRVLGYPVWVTHGIDVSVILSGWWRALIPQALLTLAAMILLGGATVLALRRAKEASAAEGRLHMAVAARTHEALEAIAGREEALAAAERANRAKSHFLASASHDLRQPIQGVRLFLDVLELKLKDEGHRTVLAHASKALEGAESLLSTLLDVSILEAGMVQPAPKALPLADLLGQMAQEFNAKAAARGLGFRHVPCREWVRSDPVLLARILRNALTNALRYTETGRVLLGCRREAGQVRVEIWDTGAGIPANKLDAIFEDFYQVGNPERDRSKGLGLGLAVVRRMASLLGHKVGVRSQLGRGTVFWVCLPVVAPSDGAI